MDVLVNAEAAISYFLDMAERADMRGQLGIKVGGLLREDIKKQFAAGGIPHWPALSPSTIDEKRRQGYPRLSRDGTIPANLVQRGEFGPQNILIRTGALLASWTQPEDEDHLSIQLEEEVIEGSNLPYAVYHQSDGPRERLPRRPILVSQELLSSVAGSVASYIVGNPE